MISLEEKNIPTKFYPPSLELLNLWYVSDTNSSASPLTSAAALMVMASGATVLEICYYYHILWRKLFYQLMIHHSQWPICTDPLWNLSYHQLYKAFILWQLYWVTLCGIVVSKPGFSSWLGQLAHSPPCCTSFFSCYSVNGCLRKVNSGNSDVALAMSWAMGSYIPKAQGLMKWWWALKPHAAIIYDP